MRIAGATAAPRNRPIIAGELHVAHAHAAGIGERGEQQQATGGRARDQAFGLAGGIEREADRERQDRAERGEAVGDDAMLEVDQRGRHDEQDQ